MSKAEINVQGFEELFGTDEQLEKEGAWMPVPGKPGAAIKLRSQTDEKVRNYALKQGRKHAALYRAGQNPSADILDQDAEDIMVYAVATDWKGFNFDNGDTIPFTKENLRAVMQQYPRFRELCDRWSSEQENYRKQGQEAVLGNSVAP